MPSCVRLFGATDLCRSRRSSPKDLWWVSVHGIYRPGPTNAAELARLLDVTPVAAFEVPVNALVHPKYHLPSRCLPTWARQTRSALGSSRTFSRPACPIRNWVPATAGDDYPLGVDIKWESSSVELVTLRSRSSLATPEPTQFLRVKAASKA